MLEKFQPLAAIATTPAALRLLYPLLDTQASIQLWVPEQLAAQQTQYGQAKAYSGSLRAHISGLWPHCRGFIFGLATGATTRLIAPLLQDKTTDPAVVVLDEAGKFVISLCGGHQGGADQLTQFLAHQLGAQPVLTGASNHQGLAGVDILGKPWGWKKGSGDWTGVSAAVAHQTSVEVIQEVGSDLWRSHLPPEHPFRFGFAQEEGPKTTARLWISTAQRQFGPVGSVGSGGIPKAQWHPRVLWVGIGCERGSSRRLIEQAIARTFKAAHLAEGAIAGIASLDLKADEVGLLELCNHHQWPLHCFPAERLQDIPVPTPSKIVQNEVGTPSVAEAAAIAAAQDFNRKNIELRMQNAELFQENASSTNDTTDSQTSASDPQPSILNSQFSTLNSQRPPLVVKKQIHRLEDEPGAVTVAVAEAAVEYTGRDGELFLVGIGPGSLDQMTTAAKGAIAAADAVIGYGLYVDLIRPLLRPGQLIEALPITQERQRAQRAIALANWGLSVAVISSGDSGIYGMAGLVMESLSHQGWDGQVPRVQVFPGVSALQAAAARVGTPLMHDFCAISLSDLLTPWEVIEKRLEAAAQADFVVALYNPKSKTRTQPMAIAQSIFLRHRSLQTPIALVRSAYRDSEEIQLTTLEELGNSQIDMLTTVLIGNASTLRHHNWLITPRGYLGQGPRN